MEPLLSAQLTGLIRERAEECDATNLTRKVKFTLGDALVSPESSTSFSGLRDLESAPTGWDLKSWVSDTMAKQSLVPYGNSPGANSVETADSHPEFAEFDGATRFTVAHAKSKYIADPSEIRDALSMNQLVLLYQPTVDLASGRIIEVEAIPHWHHVRYGLIRLDDIDYGCDVTVAGDVAKWGFTLASEQMAIWRTKYPGYGSLGLSAWICPPLFDVPGGLVLAAKLLKDSGLEPNIFTAQIDSSEIFSGNGSENSKISEARRAGFCVALDSFDGGIDAIAIVRDYPIRTLRLSAEFTARVGRLQVDPSLSRSVIGLARSMNLRVVATGVDTASQLKRLRSFGCDIAQGDLFARPLSVDELEPVLSQRAVFYHLVDSLSEYPGGL